MDDIQEHKVGDSTVRLDRNLCVGFGDCVERAPKGFELDDDDVVLLMQPHTVQLDNLLAACEACTVDALSLVDASGCVLCPTSFHSTPGDD